MSYYSPNHYSTYEVLKHKELPLYITAEFDFYRYVKFDNNFYGKTISELHSGNLREIDKSNRYADIFKSKKISYWSDSPITSSMEMGKHGRGKDFIVFMAYDDATSTFPTLSKNRSAMTIVDGRDFGFHKILEKCDNKQKLTKEEKDLIREIEKYDPDCLAYKSTARKNGVNFLFFEKGFKKLSLKSVKLILGSRRAKNSKKILCAYSSDYNPQPEQYGRYFNKLAKEGFDCKYLSSKEYKERKKTKLYWIEQREVEIKTQNHFYINDEGKPVF